MKNKKIPINALFCKAGAFEFKSKDDEQDSLAVRLLARSAKPISHWFWGNVVHDLEGVKLKASIPIDYAHNDDEVIGYLDEVEKKKDGLYLSGKLVPFTDGDRASEVNFKLKAGVPYQASINFAGDVEIEELKAGQSSKVNGFTFKGPGIIVRKWDLRGVAVCPYGADPNTSSRALAQAGEITVNIKETEPMELKEQKETTEQETPVPEAAKQISGAEKELSAPVADPAPAADPQPNPKKTADKQFSLSEFKKMADQFGSEIAAKTVLSGGIFADAQAEYIKNLKEENKRLKESSPAVSGQPPVAFNEATENDAEKPKSMEEMFSLGRKNRRTR